MWIGLYIVGSFMLMMSNFVPHIFFPAIGVNVVGKLLQMGIMDTPDIFIPNLLAFIIRLLLLFSPIEATI